MLMLLLELSERMLLSNLSSTLLNHQGAIIHRVFIWSLNRFIQKKATGTTDRAFFQIIGT